MNFLRRSAIIDGSASKKNFHWSCVMLARGPLAHQGWYPRDHQPGQYPKTEAERYAAAMKYGLRPEDYKPISQDDSTWHVGDYPDLGHLPYMDRDPYEDYAYKTDSRNWGAPVPRNRSMYTRDRNPWSSLEHKELSSYQTFFAVMIPKVLIFSLMGYLLYRCMDYQCFRYKVLAMPKQYPYDWKRAYPMDSMLQYPITNYTFEPETLQQ